MTSISVELKLVHSLKDVVRNIRRNIQCPRKENLFIGITVAKRIFFLELGSSNLTGVLTMLPYGG